MIKQMTSEELKNLILHGNKEIIKEVLENIHPADILDILHEDEDSSKEILEHLPNEVIGDILDEEDDEELILEWLNLFSKYKQKQILDEVSHDVITDVIGSIEDEDEKNAFTMNASRTSFAVMFWSPRRVLSSSDAASILPATRTIPVADAYCSRHP